MELSISAPPNSPELREFNGEKYGLPETFLRFCVCAYVRKGPPGDPLVALVTLADGPFCVVLLKRAPLTCATLMIALSRNLRIRI
jgi:hypothetical protein